MFNENDVLADLGRGDRNAFNFLYLLYAPKVESFVLKMTKDNQTAEDITHNIFLKVWEKRKIISQVDSFKQYIFRMAKNAVFDVYDHSLIKARHKESVQRKSSLSVIRYDQEEEIYSKDLSFLIDLTINKMPPKRKTVFVMSRKEGLSHKEIAEKLNISAKTVENHIAQAMGQIRKAIS